MRLVKPDPAIATLFQSDRPLRSVEFFPPKDDTGLAGLLETARALQTIQPDFVSITYGAGGSTRERTARVARMLRDDFGFLVMPHLTCVASTRDEISAVIDGLHSDGYRNIMTLRGDPPKGETVFQPYKDGLRYASDLVELIHSRHNDFCLGVAGYPEIHPEAASRDADLAHLKLKVDAGAAFITTQLFFDNQVYFDFVARCRTAGITVPIIPGIMPVLSLKQIRRFTEMCQASLPKALVDRLESAGDDADAVEMVGIDWATEQIRGLIEGGVPGYHLYILNRARSALALADRLHS